MAKRAGKAAPLPQFTWEGSAEDMNLHMRTDMQHTLFSMSGATTVQFPDGTDVDIEECPDWKEMAEHHYRAFDRAKEETYMQAKEQGVLMPVFDTTDWDTQMHDDSKKMENPYFAISGRMAIPFGKAEYATQAIDDSVDYADDYDPAKSFMSYMGQCVREQMAAKQAPGFEIEGDTILAPEDFHLLRHDGSVVEHPVMAEEMQAVQSYVEQEAVAQAPDFEEYGA